MGACLHHMAAASQQRSSSSRSRSPHTRTRRPQPQPSCSYRRSSRPLRQQPRSPFLPTTISSRNLPDSLQASPPSTPSCLPDRQACLEQHLTRQHNCHLSSHRHCPRPQHLQLPCRPRRRRSCNLSTQNSPRSKRNSRRWTPPLRRKRARRPLQHPAHRSQSRARSRSAHPAPMSPRSSNSCKHEVTTPTPQSPATSEP